MIRLQSFLYFLLTTCLIAKAQQPFVQYHTSEVYKAASLHNHYIKPDEQGALYIANNEGVMRYDGAEWNMLTLPNKDYIASMAPDSHGNIYIGSDSELGFFKKDSTGNFRYHSFKLQIPERYRNKSIGLIMVYKDIVFFHNPEFVIRYEDEKLDVIDIDNWGFLKIQGEFYLVKEDGSMMLYKNKKFEQQAFFDELKSIPIQWMTDYELNSILILDTLQQLWTFDISPGTKQRLKAFPNELQSYYKTTYFQQVRTLDNGILAIASPDEIVFMNKKGEITYTINAESIGSYVKTSTFFKDPQHNLWLSSEDALIQVIASSPLTYFDKQNGLKGVVFALGKVDSNLYVGTGQGVFYKENPTTFTPILGDVTYSLLNSQGKLYAANFNGVYEIKGKQAIQVVDHLRVYVLCEINNNPDHILMGTDSGIWLLKKEKKAKWKNQRIAGFDENINSLLQDKQGYFWVSHEQRGVYRLRLNKEMSEVSSVSLYDTRHGLPSHLNNRIYKLLNGSVVATTTDGIYRYNAVKDRFEPDKKIRDALGKKFCIYSIAENSEGDLYFWGARPQQYETAGVLKKQNDETYKVMFTPFNKTAIAIGDLGIDINAPILIAGPEDVLIGNKLRVLHYNPIQKTFYNDSIHTFIRHIWARDSILYSDQQKHTRPEIPYSNNSMKFDFMCSFYEDAEKTEYQHKLSGFENRWSAWTKSKEAAYTNIPGGDYTFLVRAKNEYGIISKPAAYIFSIQFPWYQKWWAYILYFLFLTASVWMITFYYTRQIQLQKTSLKKKVNEKTADLQIKNQEILNKNEEISMQAETLEKLNLTKDKIFSIISHDLRGPVHQVQEILLLLESNLITEQEFKRLVPDLKESIRYTVGLTDNLLQWARGQMEGMQVRPSAFDIHEIIDENFRLFKPLATRKDITLTNILETSIPVFADKDMIKLVIRNLVNNAIKFTGKHGEVIIGAEPREKSVLAYVVDTGKGIAKNDILKILGKEGFTTFGTSGERGVGLGLKLCQEFIEINSGTLYIESELGKGSKFSFTIPTRQ